MSVVLSLLTADLSPIAFSTSLLRPLKAKDEGGIFSSSSFGFLCIFLHPYPSPRPQPLKNTHNVVNTNVMVDFNIYSVLPPTSSSLLREQPPSRTPPPAGCPPEEDKAGQRIDDGCNGHSSVVKWWMQNQISLNLEVVFCHAVKLLRL